MQEQQDLDSSLPADYKAPAVSSALDADVSKLQPRATCNAGVSTFGGSCISFGAVTSGGWCLDYGALTGGSPA